MKKHSKNIKSKYQYVGFLPGSVRIKENGFWGINDYEGNEILPSNYIEVFTLSSGYGLIAAREAGYWDIYDYYGNKLNSDRFDKIYPYYGFFGLSKVKIGDNWGLLNKYGKIVVPVKYQKIEKFGKGICFYKSNEVEFIDKKELIKLTSVKNNRFKTEAKTSISKKRMGMSAKKTPTA
jgi:hypothetical protein